MACRSYLILVSYVKTTKPLPSFIRLLAENNGRVIGVNEELRRVVALIPARADQETLEKIISEYTSSTVVEVKASCSDVDTACLRSKLVKSLKAKAHGGAYYFRLDDVLLAQALIEKNTLEVKIGRGALILPAPPSIFIYELREAREILERVESAINGIVGECMLGSS